MSKQYSFNVEGSGKPVIFLHGYAENRNTWNLLIPQLVSNCSCYALDLPGHGNAPLIPALTIKKMADYVAEFIESHIQQKAFVTGHSMGGYVALELAYAYPHLVNGIGLINSHAATDNEETINTRKRTIEIIKQDHFNFLNTFIDGLFYTPFKLKLHSIIQQLIDDARSIQKETLIATQEAMMSRKEHVELLLKASFPVLFVLGKQDNRIDFGKVLGQTILPRVAYCLFLEESAHMSHIEHPKEVASIIKSVLEIV